MIEIQILKDKQQDFSILAIKELIQVAGVRVTYIGGETWITDIEDAYIREDFIHNSDTNQADYDIIVSDPADKMGIEFYPCDVENITVTKYDNNNGVAICFKSKIGSYITFSSKLEDITNSIYNLGLQFSMNNGEYKMDEE